MASTKRSTMDVYRKRQNILLIFIAVIIIALILIIVYLIVFDGTEGISQTADNNSVSDSLQAVPADAQEENVPNNDICFADESITLKVGEKFIPKIVNGSANEIINWQSENKSVVIVSDSGEISAVGEGYSAITAEASGANKLLTLIVNVVPNDEKNEDETKETTENEKEYKDGELAYIDGILIANKTYGLPEDYAPGEDPEAVAAFYTMQADAANEGLDIYISSGFRSYEDQYRIYHNYASYDGYDVADTYSARPGHSEHQTGLAFDLNTIDDSFAYTAEGEWVKDNCYKYGFIIRYPEGKEHITGYMYEPWHIRYLGVDKATEVYNSGLTLEEFLGIDSVYAE